MTTTLQPDTALGRLARRDELHPAIVRDVTWAGRLRTIGWGLASEDPDRVHLAWLALVLLADLLEAETQLPGRATRERHAATARRQAAREAAARRRELAQ